MCRLAVPVNMLLVAVLLFVTAHNLHAATVSTQRGNNMDIITFPIDDTTGFDSKSAKLQAALINKFGDGEIHESCKKQTFCTIMPPNYPEKEFNDLFQGYKIPPMPTVEVLGNRQGDPTYENGCEVQPTFEPLYKVRAKRDDDAWRTVVQAPDHDFIQRVRLETCLSTGSCFTPLLDTNPQYETSCIQMYTVWELLVQKLDGNGTERIKAELPTCCSCKYKDIKFLTRFAEKSAKESVSNKTKV